MQDNQPSTNNPTITQHITKLTILDNKKCRIVSSDEIMLKRLHKHLSFKMIGAEYTAAFQGGWDGITYLMSKNGSFSSGLLFKVKEYLTEHQVSFMEQDFRAPVIIEPEIDLTARLVSLGLVPRDYQEEIVRTACANRKGIVRAATGSGKSLVTALIAAKLNKPVVLYVIGLDLLKQFHDLFSSIFDEPIGYIGDGVCKVERINIATIWTIGRSLKLDKKSIISDEEVDDGEKFEESHTEKIIRMLQQSKVHIFDESHVITTETIKTIYKVIDPEYIYGFSGTPFRDDGSELLAHSILGEQIIDISASRLIKSGVLAQPIIKFVAVPKQGLSSANYQSVYKTYIVENKDRNELIVKSAKMLLEKKYVPLVLFKQIKHGEILFEMMKDAGIKCEKLSGCDSLERRNEVKAKLTNREIDLVLASTIFEIGIDLPVVSALVLANGSKSRIKILQKIGRAIRKYPGKTVAAIVDFYDQTKYLKQHSIIRCETYLSEPGFKVIKCAGMK